MKALKIFLIVLLILFTVIIVGGYFFIKHFDLNKYKDEIARRIGEPLGTNVAIGKMNLDFNLQTGVQLNASDIMLEDKGLLKGISVDVEEIALALDLVKYLSDREVMITNINLREPVIRLDLAALKKEEAPTSAPQPEPDKQSEPAKSLGRIGIETIGIQDGELIVKADGKNYVKDIEVKDIDLNVKDLQLAQTEDSGGENVFTGEPFRVTLSLAAFDAGKAVSLEGKGWIDLSSQQVRLDDVVIESDLANLSLGRMTETFPALAQAGLRELNGILNIKVSQVIAGANGVPVLIAEGSLTKGRVGAVAVPVPLSDIHCYAEYSNNNLDVRESFFNAGSGRITFKGRIEDVLSAQLYNFEIKSENVQLGEVIPEVDKEIDFGGGLNGTAALKGAGFQFSDLVQNLNIQAGFIVNEGRIENFNILNYIFNKISVIPALGTAFVQALPQDYQEKINLKETVFESVAMNATMDRGVASYFVNAAADVAGIDAKGTLDWKNNFSFQGNLTLPAGVSQDLINDIPEFSALRVRNQISIPFAPYRGSLMNFRPLPDVEYLTKVIIKSKAREEIRGLLDGVLGGEEGEEGPAINDVIGDILGVEPEQRDSQGDQPQSEEQNGEQPQERSPSEPDVIDTIFDSIFNN
ncbi:MAG: AsmA family protein [Candidatus Omnitrophota bacterium]